jgi:hypothetical protein
MFVYPLIYEYEDFYKLHGSYMVKIENNTALLFYSHGTNIFFITVFDDLLAQKGISFVDEKHQTLFRFNCPVEQLMNLGHCLSAQRGHITPGHKSIVKSLEDEKDQIVFI